MRRILSAFLLLCSLVQPVSAAELDHQGFIRTITPQFAPAVERCGAGYCRRLGFEDIITWQSETEPQITYWSVTVVMIGSHLAQRFTYQAQPRHQLRLIHQTTTFTWLQD